MVREVHKEQSSAALSANFSLPPPPHTHSLTHTHTLISPTRDVFCVWRVSSVGICNYVRRQRRSVCARRGISKRTSLLGDVWREPYLGRLGRGSLPLFTLAGFQDLPGASPQTRRSDERLATLHLPQEISNSACSLRKLAVPWIQCTTFVNRLRGWLPLQTQQ